MVLLLLLPSAAASGAAAVATEDLQGRTVVVLQESQGSAPATISLQDLQAMILSKSMGGETAEVTDVAGSGMTMANAPVVESWRDIADRLVNLRENIRTKIINVHGLEIDTVRKVTQRTVREADGGTRYHYDLDAVLIQCGIWNCTEVDRQEVLVQVDIRTNTTDKRQFGVTTAFCPGAGDLCPAWVNASIN